MLTMHDIMVPPPAPGEMLDFTAMFGRTAPVEMEIGTGKGGFLLNRARSHPETNFFGVEWANKIYEYAADRMARWGVTNVKLMRADAGHLVRHNLPEASLNVLHIYHPDPWPKKRHHKRRLMQPEFLAAVSRALVPGGRLAIQTDHAEYFAWIQAMLRGEPRLAEVAFDVPEAGVVNGRIASNYEVKYEREGRSFYRIALQRVA